MKRVLHSAFTLVLCLILISQISVISFAEEGTTSKPEPEKIIYYGDVNGNFRVDTLDARRILQFALRIICITHHYSLLADMNRDGKVKAVDARLALRTAMGLEELVVYDGPVGTDEWVCVDVADIAEPYTPTVTGFSTNINDESVFPILKQLEQYCSYFGNTCTFYYTDVREKYYISYYSDRVYRTQCSIKAPYIKALLVYLEENDISIDSTIQLKSSHCWSGHYLNSSYRLGSWIPIHTVMHYALHYSCNTAYNCLFDTFGADILNKNSQRIGSNLRLGWYMFGENNAYDMSKHYLDIYRYNGKYKDFLLYEMEHNESRTRIPMGIPSGIRVINKIGTGGGKTLGYHDCAVVYTQVPYVLTCYTSFNFTRGSDRIPFRNIASYITQINQNVSYE
ncbi:MAG TPA: hypothetical protein GXZ23_06100 [Clostridiales bacterium]|nr:hypothetical protein [Clostridiales bacterium]